MSYRYPAILLALSFASFGFVRHASAQVNRHELGLRLRAFERHLADTPDAERRSAAYEELNRAVQAFFRLDTKAVVRAIAAAEAALTGQPHTPAEAFAHSLQLRLRRRLAEPGDGKLEATLSAAYEVELDTPLQGLQLRLQLPGGSGSPLQLDVTELPMSIAVPLEGLPVGDSLVTWSLTLDNQVLTRRQLGLSITADLKQRLSQLKSQAGTIKKQCRSGDRDASIETETLEFLAKMVSGTQRRRAAETILPGHRLLGEAEQLATSIAENGTPTAPYYCQERPGSFWLRVPTEDRTITTRFFAPEIPKANAEPQRRPIVIALHGAGGSENLFFDGYGDGLCVRLAAERGWFVVAPRVVLGGVDCIQLVDALARRYQIDKEHVFVVGHSMGAAQAIDNAMRNPSRLRAVAALGGSGQVRRTAPIKKLPFLVAAGSRDFALRGARQLHRSLEARGANAKWLEYETVEHFAIVQIALPDVFQFFDLHKGR